MDACVQTAAHSISIPVLTHSDRSSSSYPPPLRYRLLQAKLEQQQMTDLRIALRTKNFSMHYGCRNTDAYLVKSPTYSVLLSYIVGYYYSVNLILFSF